MYPRQTPFTNLSVGISPRVGSRSHLKQNAATAAAANYNKAKRQAQSATAPHSNPSPDKFLKIQRKSQLRNAILQRFKAKFLKKQKAPTSVYMRIVEQIEKQIDRFLRTERLTQDKLQKLDAILKDVVEKELIRYKRDGQVPFKPIKNTATMERTSKNNIATQRRSVLGQVGKQMAAANGAANKSELPQLRSRTPFGLQGFQSSVASRSSKRGQLSTHSRLQNQKYDNFMKEKNVNQNLAALNQSEGGEGRLEMAFSSSMNLRSSLKQNNQWNKIIVYNTKKHQEELKKQQDKLIEKRMQQRQVLDKQMVERKERKQKERADLQSYWNQQKKVIEIEENEEQKKTRMLKEKVLKQKDERLQQVNSVSLEQKRKKQQQKHEQRQFEERKLKQLKTKMQIQNKAIVEKRKNERQHYKKMINQNLKLKAKMLEMKEQQRQAQFEEQKKYEKYVDDQYKKQQEQKKARVDRIQKRMNKMADVVLKNDKQRELQEERIFLKQVEQKQRYQIENEKKKKQNYNNEVAKTREILRKQLKEKQELKAKNLEDEARMMKKWVQDDEDYLVEKKVKDQKIKKKNQEQADYLKRQMEARARAQSRMNEHQYLLNKHLLDKIESQVGQVE